MTAPLVTVRIPSRYEDIPLVRRVLAAVCQDAPLGAEAMRHVDICLIEALGNVIRHAYGMRDTGEIEVTFSPRSDRLVVEISDRGEAMSEEIRGRLLHGEDPDPPDTLPVDEIPEGGMGFPIMRRVLDEVTYRTGKGRNTLRMTKRHAASASPAG